MSAANLGATQQEWDHFHLILGLTADLLPVVSNPDAIISPQSKIKSLGKTPSRYNNHGQVAGIANWTQKHATAAEVAAWCEVPDLGICIQTRRVRALDCDISDNPVFARIVREAIDDALSLALPCRRRANSSKFLLAFALDGEYAKRTIQTDHGTIEFLATGQQFVAAGTHPSGERYAWDGKLPDDIPNLAAVQFESLWTKLVEAFASDGTSDVAAPTIRHAKITGAIDNDPVAQSLINSNIALSTERDGRIHLVCPFSSEHTGDSDESATTYFPAFTGGFERGHFKCLHAHCSGRTDAEFLAALGLGASGGEFEVEASEVLSEKEGGVSDTNKYVFQAWADLINAKPLAWHIKGVLPRATLCVIYGAPSSGKTFFALDLGCAVARGVPWRGAKVRQGTVAYVAAEDAHGVRMRARAYAQAHNIESMPFYVLDASPNFRDFADMTQVAKAVVALGDVSLIVVDTWARALAGGDENSAKDVGEAVSLCAKLHRATGATVVLVHHSGKDSTKGARGSTALLGAVDCEIEVSRCDDEREAGITKMKNGVDGTRFAFRLRVVPVAVDDDGDVVSSCVLEHIEARAPRLALEPRGVNERIVLRALDDLCVGGPVATADAIDAAVSRMPFDDASGKRDQRRKSAIAALNALIGQGVLTAEGNEIRRKGEQ